MLKRAHCSAGGAEPVSCLLLSAGDGAGSCGCRRGATQHAVFRVLHGDSMAVLVSAHPSLLSSLIKKDPKNTSSILECWHRNLL